MPAKRSPDALAAALTFVAAGAAFGALGYWLDVTFGTLPLFLLIGLIVGFTGGFISLLGRLAPEMLPFGKKRPHDAADADPKTDHDSDR